MSKRIRKQKFAKWFLLDDNWANVWQCSLCNHVSLLQATSADDYPRYCPHCGARMTACYAMNDYAINDMEAKRYEH